MNILYLFSQNCATRAALYLFQRYRYWNNNHSFFDLVFYTTFTFSGSASPLLYSPIVHARDKIRIASYYFVSFLSQFAHCSCNWTYYTTLFWITQITIDVIVTFARNWPSRIPSSNEVLAISIKNSALPVPFFHVKNHKLCMISELLSEIAQFR